MLPTRADPLAGGDRRALGDHDRAGLEVHEDVVAAVVAGDHDVVAGARGLVGDPVHGAAARRHDRRALGGGDVLALMGVAGAAGAEARALAAEVERALDREELEPALASEARRRAARAARRRSAACAGSASCRAPLTTSRAVYLPAGSAARPGVADASAGADAAEPHADGGLAGRDRSTRTSAPGVARKANVTGAPGATLAGVTVKPRAVGPATAPPLAGGMGGGGEQGEDEQRRRSHPQCRRTDRPL